MLGDCCGEAPRVGQILCIGAIGKSANEAGSRVMQLPTAQEAAYHICPFASQQPGKVVQHSARLSASSRKDKRSPFIQGWQGP